MVSAAESDLRVASGLLDVRHLTGDPNLTLRLRTTMLAQWRRDARERLPELHKLVRSRHDLMGELAHESVPDLKEAEGGIRDATVLKSLVATWLVDVPHVELERSRLALLDVRDLVHDLAGRATDRIAPELWTELGAALAPQLGSADARAAQVHVRELGRRITHLSRLTWRRVDDALARPAHVGVRRPSLTPRGRGRRAGRQRGRARQAGPPGRGPRAAAAGRRRGRRAGRRAGPADRGPAGPRVPRRCPIPGRRRRGGCWSGCWPRGAGCSAPGRPSRRPGRSRRSCPSGSGSGCCRTRRRSTGSPSTGTWSRPAPRPRR